MITKESVDAPPSHLYTMLPLPLSTHTRTQVGIEQVGVRRRILESVVSMHKQQWRMPKDAGLPTNRQIR